LRFQIEKLAANPLRVRPEFTVTRNGRIIGTSQWRDPEGRLRERCQVITLREDGKIADLQDCASRRAAERFAGGAA
jgi:hypothetical protein